MSTNVLNPAELKCGPFFHQGGWVTTNSPIWISSGFTGRVEKSPLNLSMGWFYNVTRHGVIQTLGPPRGEATTGFRTRALAQRAYESEMRREKWNALWAKAIENMPNVCLPIKVTRWQRLPPGTTALPDFVKGNAYGKMKSMNGAIYELRSHVMLRGAAKQALAARVFGYVFIDKKTRRLTVNSMGFSSAISKGATPRDPERCKLLLRLASREGPLLAAKLVAKWIDEHPPE